jgi:hypothetical protein
MKLCKSLSIALVGATLWANAGAEQTHRWFRCNTHTHTGSFANSDANASAEYAAQWYKTHGYQCLVITDHEHLTPVDVLNHQLGGDGQFLVIQGQEITQGVADSTVSGGVRWSHVNGIDTNRVILPIGYPTQAPSGITLIQEYARRPPTSVSLADTYVRNIDAVLAAGGIAQVNHPSGINGPRLEDLLRVQKPFLLEVWNAFPSIGALGGVSDKGEVIPSFESLWDNLLSRGKTVWGTAADDVHDYFGFDDRSAPTPGKAWIMIDAPELSEKAIMTALQHGHFYASTGVLLRDYQVDPHSISFSIDAPLFWKSANKTTVLYHTRFVGQDGKTLKEGDGPSASYKFTGKERYVRASIVDSDGRRAWTQPVFRDGRVASQP